MPPYELVTYEPAQRGDYLRLLEDAWGDLALTGPEFDWWFRENPVGSLMSVATANGRVVGVAVVLAFASNPTAPIFLGPLGWTNIGGVRVWARPKPHLRGRARPVARVERFRHAGDTGSEWPNHIVRDARYLNWRFVESPRRYEAFAAAGSYAVLGHKEHRGTRLEIGRAHV